jgi:hypothetical protein
MPPQHPHFSVFSFGLGLLPAAAIAIAEEAISFDY